MTAAHEPPDPDEVWAAAVAAAVEASCAAQGVPVHVEDEAVLDRVASILRAGEQQRAKGRNRRKAKKKEEEGEG